MQRSEMLVPLIVMAKNDGELEQAIRYDQALLAPSQMRVPDSLEEALNRAVLFIELFHHLEIRRGISSRIRINSVEFYWMSSIMVL